MILLSGVVATCPRTEIFRRRGPMVMILLPPPPVGGVVHARDLA